MLLRPRRPAPLAPSALPSPASPDSDLQPAEDEPGTPLADPATPSALAAPESPKSPVSPGSAQRTPWSERETELLLGTLLQPTVWRSLLLDRRQAQPTYRRVSAALARQQVRRTPAQCRRRYKFLKDKLRDAQGQPSGPFDAQIRELMGLLGDHGRRRVRRRPAGPGRPQRGRRRASAVPARFLEEPGGAPQPATRDPDADPACLLRFNPSSPRSAEPCFAPGSSMAHAPSAFRTFVADPAQAPGTPPPPDPDPSPEGPNTPPSRPDDSTPPQLPPPTLNSALLQTLTHLGDIVAILGPLRDQLQALNQHVEQLRGSFDQTVSLAVGFILGNAAAERGVLRDLHM
ncbi:undifferentiated embryonic cell transcription factor 1 [Octodon degus]|uniref:Undifferentiated embryonic cell transcription factor 1 n=1 Tax=Octodon degus TaxID=10160 RepID=A0A6P3ELD3_OCTDE|nr:undifferentiated embryonic cell transcription factor 1 [Octodon degus]